MRTGRDAVLFRSLLAVALGQFFGRDIFAIGFEAGNFAKLARQAAADPQRAGIALASDAGIALTIPCDTAQNLALGIGLGGQSGGIIGAAGGLQRAGRRGDAKGEAGVDHRAGKNGKATGAGKIDAHDLFLSDEARL